MKAYPTLHLEGGLFAPDLFEALHRGELSGQKPSDFGLPSNRNLLNEIAAVYNDARKQWQIFRNRFAQLPENESDTSLTRNQWLIPFLSILGYELHRNERAFELDGMSFAISHSLEPLLEGVQPTPVHLVGYRQELGRVAASGRPRLSPHALVQEYLNRSEALWGLVTNGRILRLLRNTTFLRRQTYLEFDLEQLFEEERFADFVLLYRLLHRSRLPSGPHPEACLLELYYQQSLEQGGRVRERLRAGVEQCLVLLANGFLRHPANAALRHHFSPPSSPEEPGTPSPSNPRSAQGELRDPSPPYPPLPQGERGEKNLPSPSGRGAGGEGLYRQLLRLVYRFLFLLVAEERGLMGNNPLYLEHYGVSRLRRLCENRSAYTDNSDLWHGLRALWLVFQNEEWATLLGVPPLNGELFAKLDLLDDAVITNRDLLSAFWHLAFYDDPPRRVNYAALDTEELGSVYESLLDYHPMVAPDSGGRLCFELARGSERKSTGSYYTPPQLVGELIRSALEPVIAARLQGLTSPQAREQALLSIKVCDPACGSGHFLLAAARRLGKELARIRTGEDEPAPEAVRLAIRDVVTRCIYGVDKNPLAVELARVALWLESHAAGKPLTFLEHRIRCGDSLVGVFDLSVLQAGIPDDAFEPLQGDDRKLAASLKRQNRAEREGQMTLFGWNFDFNLDNLAQMGQEIEAIPDDSPEQVRSKRERYEARWNDPALRRYQQACNLWTAAFFQTFPPSPSGRGAGGESNLPSPSGRGAGGEGITTEAVRRALAGQPVPPQTLAQAESLAVAARFFHWQLEFPEVFERGGFDVILGNPPFGAELSQGERKFLKFVYPDAGSSNTASLFWYVSLNLTNNGGWAGLVTPKSITYSTRWSKLRTLLLPCIEKIIDCGQAWDEVLLEQVLVAVGKAVKSSHIKTQRLFSGTSNVFIVSREMVRKLDVWLISPEYALVEILERFQNSPRGWLFLGEILSTQRGKGFQRIMKKQGEIPVIAGKDIAPYTIKSISGFLTMEQVDDLSLFESPKAVFQNIVAYVSHPLPHIKIIGAVDYSGMVCLDTVNIVRCPKNIFSPESIVAILCSRPINWLIHRVVFGFAQRTMHFDQFALNRIFIPRKLLDMRHEIHTLASRLIQSSGKDRSAVEDIDYLIFEAYELDSASRRNVLDSFE